jgi:hypothetical protein
MRVPIEAPPSRKNSGDAITTNLVLMVTRACSGIACRDAPVTLLHQDAAGGRGSGVSIRTNVRNVKGRHRRARNLRSMQERKLPNL